ncbi:MAG: hypothetical protein B7Z51_01155, partial [Methyloversatilis sp. 12-65-5]
MNRKIFPELLDLLMCEAPEAKCAAVASLWADWQAGVEFDRTAALPRAVDEPGRPARPELVEPSALRSRRVGTREGHAAMIH